MLPSIPKTWVQFCIPLGVSSNMQFCIPYNIPWSLPWITLQFPFFGNHCLTYYKKHWFCLITGWKHGTICPSYLQVPSEDETELWLKSILCLFSDLSQVHRYFHTLINLIWCIINTNFPKKCTQIIPKRTDPSRFHSLHKRSSEY